MAEKEIKKSVMDVEKPGTTPASATSRPVIISKGPAIKDPMVNETSPEVNEQPTPLPSPSAKKKTIQPISEQPKEVAAETKSDTVEKTPSGSDIVPDLVPTEEEEKAATAEAEANLSEEERKRQELTDKLIAEKKYFVPIGVAEKRRTARNTMLLFAIFITLVGGVTLAIDAELVQTNITLPFDLIK